jgi:hypothetical protein
MPRFFFHLRGDGQNFEDAIGSEFETVQHAEMAALRAASHMLEEAKEPAQLEDRYFEITDRTLHARQPKKAVACLCQRLGCRR